MLKKSRNNVYGCLAKRQRKLNSTLINLITYNPNDDKLYIGDKILLIKGIEKQNNKRNKTPKTNSN